MLYVSRLWTETLVISVHVNKQGMFFWLSQVFGAVGYARELEMEGKRKGEEAKN